MPWKVMTSSLREADRLQREEPARFDAIVSEGLAVQPELADEDEKSIVALYIYDQRVNTA